MTTSNASRPMTADDLLRMPGSGKGFELVDGTLVALNSGAESSWIGGKLASSIASFLETQPLGWIFAAGAGFQCFSSDAERVRKPDASFVRFGRFPGETLPTGFGRLAPDLAVEVIAPNDLANEVEEKIRDYLRAGVRLIWVVYPSTRSIHIHRPDRSSARLNERDELDGEDVLPGFRRPVRDFFPPRPMVEEIMP